MWGCRVLHPYIAFTPNESDTMKPSFLCTILAVTLAGTTARAQTRVGFGADIGTAVAMGDLGRSGQPGLTAALSARIGKVGSRSSFGIEGHFERIPLDSLYIPAVSDPGVPNTGEQRIPASTFRAIGAIARLDYTVAGGLYAISGLGLLSREREYEQAPVAVATVKSTDPVAQIGLGYRLGSFLVIEARFLNVFTVNQSERMIPITAGIRF